MQKNKKITIKGKVKIYETDNETRVIKPKKKELKSLFEYLERRDFHSFPEIIEERSDTVEYKYYDENISPFNETSYDEEFIKEIASLHYKTTYQKNVSIKKYKEIYNKLIENIDYLKDHFENTIKEIDGKDFMSPSEYLFARNYTIINSNLLYIEKELNAWYNLVKNKTKERVSIIHNNLKKDNFIRGEKNIITSWDNFLVDTPILDIYKLYKNEYKTMDFNNLLKIYNETYQLNKEEIKLFFIMISMPKKLEKKGSEYTKVCEIKNLLNYTYRTNELIKSGIFN